MCIFLQALHLPACFAGVAVACRLLQALQLPASSLTLQLPGCFRRRCSSLPLSWHCSYLSVSSSIAFACLYLQAFQLPAGFCKHCSSLHLS